MTPQHALDRLAAYRLEQDLSFDRLSARMTSAGCPVKTRALHLALNGRLQTLPHARTLYKIVKFLDGLDSVALVRQPRKHTAKKRAATA